VRDRYGGREREREREMRVCKRERERDIEREGEKDIHIYIYISICFPVICYTKFVAIFPLTKTSFSSRYGCPIFLVTLSQYRQNP